MTNAEIRVRNIRRDSAVISGRGATPKFDESDTLVLTTPSTQDVIEIGGVRFAANDRCEVEINLANHPVLNGHIGLLSVTLNGASVGEFEIIPGKMSLDRYAILRSDLERIWSGLVFDPNGIGRLAAEIPAPAVLLRRLDSAIASILGAPHDVLGDVTTMRHLRAVKRPQELSPSLLRRSQFGLPGLTRTLARMTANSENAATAATLQSLVRYAVRQGDEPTARRCRTYLRHPLFQQQRGDGRQVGWAMRNDPRYRQVLDVARLLDRPELGATEGPGELRLGVSALTRLYEYWVFLKVLEAAQRTYGPPLGRGYASLAVRTSRGARLEIAAGTTVEFPGQVHVAFEPRITQTGSGWMGLEYVGPVPLVGAPSQTMATPDVVVFRAGDRPSAVVFDAKYVGRHFVEQDAAQIHRKYARIRCSGRPIVRAVIALHPHVGYSNIWSGYGHIGLAPGSPDVALPLPGADKNSSVVDSRAQAPPERSSAQSNELKVIGPTRRESVVVIIDQFSTREMLVGRRVAFEQVVRDTAGGRRVGAALIVMPDIPQLAGFEHAVRAVGLRVVHQADTSAEARRSTIEDLVDQWADSHDIALITIDRTLVQRLSARNSAIEIVDEI